MSGIDLAWLKPGVIDGYARRVFTAGACGAIALALHDRFGWPLIAITEADNVHEGIAGGGSSVHYMVRVPDGRLLDILGLHTDEEALEEWGGHTDDGEGAIGVSAREDVWEWYGLNQGEPVPIELAASFAEPLVEANGL